MTRNFRLLEARLVGISLILPVESSAPGKAQRGSFPIGTFYEWQLSDDAEQADCNPAFAGAIIGLMHISDPREVEEVLSFFRTHLGRELDIAVSIFESITQYERMKVQEVDAAPPRVLLLAPKSQRQIAIDPNQFSFATVSPDHTRLEVGRLLGSNMTMRLTARELA